MKDAGGWDFRMGWKNFPCVWVKKSIKTLQTAFETQKKGYSIGTAQNWLDKKSKAKPETARRHEK